MKPMDDPRAFEERLSQFLNGELSGQERLAFAAVLKNNPQAQAAFDQALHDEALLYAAHGPKPDAKAMAQALSSRLRAAASPRRRNWAPLGLAAALALALCAWWFAVGPRSSAGPVATAVAVPSESVPVRTAGLRCVVFGMVEDNFDGAKFRFRSSLVFRRVSGVVPLGSLEGRTFDVEVPAEMSGTNNAVAVRDEIFKKLKRGAYATLAIEVDERGAIKLLKVPEAMGPHYPGQCACRQGQELIPPNQAVPARTQG